jgi:hypothetical protein
MNGLPRIETPSQARLLDAWEAGRERALVWRGLLLLSVAHPREAWEDLLTWSVGRRNLHLLSLRSALFGPQMTATAACPYCADRLELQFAAAELVAPTPADLPNLLALPQADRVLHFRLPNSEDLAALTYCHNVEEARQLLVRRCLQEDGADLADFPEDWVQSVAERMAEADPQADVRLALVCSSCAGEWTAAFDIVTYLWAEVESWAQRTLLGIHLLAGAYGWRQDEILALSSWRRQRYLEMIVSRGGERL